MRSREEPTDRRSGHRAGTTGRGGTGTVLLDVPVRPLSEWLMRTSEAVPPGKESAWIDWDAILEKLLDDR
ncbi:hypothetical protein GCM10010299_54250 [Streptomyces tanashiensis]|nr:hypothetical protein GCM10010299_54250 [Streptomyces tanashiensis]